MSATFYIGDVLETMAKLPAGSVDLILTSPPFLALRSYLPADHPDKAKEGGSQSTPGEFIDWLIDFAEASARVLAPHGSFCVELGDTYSGSGGAGGDYAENGLREGQPKFRQGKDGWPMAKSLALIPEMFRFSLVYGFNPLTGRQTERWRLRNVVRWVRPNPPVGALGDKFRPATSELMVFCKSAKRYFDLDAVRTDHQANTMERDKYSRPMSGGLIANPRRGDYGQEGVWSSGLNPIGAPPLDWWEIPPGGSNPPRPVNPGEFAGGTLYIRSAGCPVHEDRPAPASTVPHGEPADSPSTRSSGNGGRPARGRQPGSVPTVQPTLLTLEDASSDSLNPLSIPAATPRSKASNRTAPAPGSTSPGNASGRTRRRIDDTSSELLSDGPRPDTPGNRTWGVYPPDPALESYARTGRKPPELEACTCTFYQADSSHYAVFPEEVPLDWWEIPPGGFTGSHYAVMPLELCVKPVKAMSPERVCKVCGEPSRRMTEKTEDYAEFRLAAKTMRKDPGMEGAGKGSGGLAGSGYNRDPHGVALGSPTAIHRSGEKYRTVGFTDCGHDSWRPGLILDPFGGSGTVAAVATGHGRDCILIDLDERNFDLALGRVGPFMLTLGNIDE